MSLFRLRTAALALVLLGTGCESEAPFPTEDELEQLSILHTPSVKPEVDPTNKFGDNASAAALGHRLFEDKGLSRCGTVSCRTATGATATRWRRPRRRAAEASARSAIRPAC